MELKDFVKTVLLDLDKAVTEVNESSGRVMRFKGVKEARTSVEFDVAVTVERNDNHQGGGEIKVWGIAEAGLESNVENRHSTVSRVSFGIHVDEYTRDELTQKNQAHSRRSTRAALR
jgi:hypothetical protein